MPIPDQDRHMSEVHALAHEVRGGNTSPLREVRAAPIYMGNSHDVIPERYVIHFSRTTCANCGKTSEESEFFALSYLRSRLGATRVRHLVRCDAPLFNLPVDRISTGEHKTPFCSLCPAISLDHLPPPPMAAQIYDLPEEQKKQGKKRPPTPVKDAPTKSASLDDLI
jgi:hypothetical protein